MQVPLDYYRILMVPIQADSRQIEQAYRQRLTQELWPGYSATALEGRRHLIDEAITVLLDPMQRQSYDAHLTASNPNLNLADPLLPGALVILWETGDYRAALEITEGLLRTHHSAVGDLLLTQALCHLWLGREAWQQGSYEAAAQTFKAALGELVRFQAFPQLQLEIAADLNKLRPYRILQLLSHPEDGASERQQGMSLLKGLLDERGGVEGSGMDGSGLATEDLMRFIQRCRRQLTLSEQQSLFESEAERPSVVATYIAVQTLLARGYLENRPGLVRKARSYLIRLSQRQPDFHLEEAICCLLLGQTDEALHQLSFCQENEPLTFIQTQSGGSPDWLPGLCRYTERWFEYEVFPEFRHLVSPGISLQTYFDNPQVQAYLDEMMSPLSEEPPPLSSQELGGGSRGWSRIDPVATVTHPDPGISGPGISGPGISVPPFHPEPVAASLNGADLYGIDPNRSGMNGTNGTGGPSRVDATERIPTSPERITTNASLPSDPLPRASDLPPYPRENRRPREPKTPPPSRPRRRSTRTSRIATLLGPLAAGALFVGGIVLIVQVARSLFTPTAPPEEPPLVDLNQAPVTVSSVPQPESSPAIPPEWIGIRQVRVLSADGIRIREQPDRASTSLGTAPSQSVLTILEVKPGTGDIPIWLKVERPTGPNGWVAAQLGTRPLVEKMP